MIVGYTTADNTVFCAACWAQREPERPDRVLDTENLSDPDDTFWVGDICATCRSEVKYREARFAR